MQDLLQMSQKTRPCSIQEAEAARIRGDYCSKGAWSLTNLLPLTSKAWVKTKAPTHHIPFQECELSPSRQRNWNLTGHAGGQRTHLIFPVRRS